MGPTWCPPGSYRPQMGPMLAPWTSLSGLLWFHVEAVRHPSPMIPVHHRWCGRNKEALEIMISNLTRTERDNLKCLDWIVLNVGTPVIMKVSRVFKFMRQRSRSHFYFGIPGCLHKGDIYCSGRQHILFIRWFSHLYAPMMRLWSHCSLGTFNMSSLVT